MRDLARLAGRHASDGTEELEPSGFFALRTPLLPVEDLAAVGRGRDGASVREDLRAAWQRPEVAEGVHLASPALATALDEPTWRPGAARAFWKYFTRMATRPTPFGVFAGTTLGAVGAHTHLDLAPRSSYRRVSRLQLSRMIDLVHAFAPSLEFEPNSSLYRAGGRFRYVRVSESRCERLSVDDTPYLRATLARARHGATVRHLAQALMDERIDAAHATRYVEQLIEDGVLVSSIAPQLTGDDPDGHLIQRLARFSITAPLAQRLAGARASLERIDVRGVGAQRSAYEALGADLQGGLEVDLLKPAAEGLTLGPLVVTEMRRAVTILRRITPSAENAILGEFRERFRDRYGDAEVPLVEALDAEVGIGFELPTSLDQTVRGPAEQTEQAPADVVGWWRTQDEIMLRKLTTALASGSASIDLQGSDIAQLSAVRPERPSESLAVIGRLAARTAADIDRGNFSLWVRGVAGPPGVQSLGRLAASDAAVRQALAAHVRAEQRGNPGSVFAEIVCLPDRQHAPVQRRPVLRDYEIPYLARSGAPPDRQLPVHDLLVSIVHDRVVLRSRRLGCEVIPRQTTAHEYAGVKLPVYTFLCVLQGQAGFRGLAWDWGALARAPFLPRVIHGRLVLSLARWNVFAPELRELVSSDPARRLTSIGAWRERRGIPHKVALFDRGELGLVVDFGSALSTEAFLHEATRRPWTTLSEPFPADDELCVRGPEGHFVHELIVPFLNTRPASVRAAPNLRHTSSEHRFGPGSEWLYANLYCGPATADGMLLDVVRSVVRPALHEGAADGWFFIRYGDPDWHIRLRLHGDPTRLSREVAPVLFEVATKLTAELRLSRLQLDTYTREVNRYGGPRAIVAAEHVFEADSEFAVDVIEQTLEDGGANLRWQLALCGIDMLLSGMGFDRRRRCEWAIAWRDALAAGSEPAVPERRALGAEYRRSHLHIEHLLRAARGCDSNAPERAPWIQSLATRSRRVKPVLASLRELERGGCLSVGLDELAASYAHLHINRVLPTGHRVQEFLISDVLARVYVAEHEKSRFGRGRQPT